MIKGLKANTTYHYTIWAENSAGVAKGEGRAFTTGRVTLVNGETKKPLAVGTTVHGEVEQLTFTSSNLLSYCYFGNFDAVVIANPANPALLNQIGYLEFGLANKCDNPYGADWLTLTKESFKLGAKGPTGLGPMQLFSDGTANVDTDFDYVSFASSCSVEGSGSEKWNRLSHSQRSSNSNNS